MITRVDVRPELLTWACERGGLGVEGFEDRFPALPAWIRGDTQPTLKQIEKFARATHTPVGYLFLPLPPVEEVPIPDLRTMGGAPLRHPSPDLLETIYLCQQRQEWFREFARAEGEVPCEFAGSVKLSASVETTARRMREALEFDLEARARMRSWSEALRGFIQQADHLGVLVMVNGVVGNDTHRKLAPDEFRGFALADEWAPLVFVNGADTKAAQIFTLAHELAHIWLGRSALSDVPPATRESVDRHPKMERWCNEVAAELLVPLAALRAELVHPEDLRDRVERLARRFKVSTLVVLRRLHDAGAISRNRMWAEYSEELERLMSLGRRGSGGDFYLTQTTRVGRRFAQALVATTLEGRTLHRDAFRLLGFSKLETFRKLGERLGVI